VKPAPDADLQDVRAQAAGEADRGAAAHGRDLLGEEPHDLAQRDADDPPEPLEPELPVLDPEAIDPHELAVGQPHEVRPARVLVGEPRVRSRGDEAGWASLTPVGLVVGDQDGEPDLRSLRAGRRHPHHAHELRARHRELAVRHRDSHALPVGLEGGGAQLAASPQRDVEIGLGPERGIPGLFPRHGRREVRGAVGGMRGVLNDPEDLVGRDAHHPAVFLEDDLPGLFRVARDHDRVAAVHQVDEEGARGWRLRGLRRRRGSGDGLADPAGRPRGRARHRRRRAAPLDHGIRPALRARRGSGWRGRCPRVQAQGQDGEHEPGPQRRDAPRSRVHAGTIAPAPRPHQAIGEPSRRATHDLA
jgi:hypothetical protein